MTVLMGLPVPEIVSREADERFRSLARGLGLDPDNRWVGEYVNYEWAHGRHIFESLEMPFAGKSVLEFGCNLGATSVVLAALGAKVTAVDVDDAYIGLGVANVARYGLEGGVEFLHVSDTTKLPFLADAFDYVVCNSVLEYVPHDILPAVQKEIDRTLKKRGVIFVMGTSNRLWPREMHSRRWLVNYIPRAFDPILFKARPERGVLPWEIRSGFADYENLDLTDGGAAFLKARAKMGMSAVKLRVLALANALSSRLGISVGLLNPSISVILRKTGN